MRWGVIATLLVLISPVMAMQGYCTGVYLERGPDHVEGLISPGDVFEYWCELPEPLRGHQAFGLQILYPNADLAAQLLAPRVIYGTTLVIYP
jgi:hypothetical protein